MMGKRYNPSCMVNGMGTSATQVSCGKGEIVCERRDGVGITERTVGREKSGIHITAERETVETGTR